MVVGWEYLLYIENLWKGMIFEMDERNKKEIEELLRNEGWILLIFKDCSLNCILILLDNLSRFKFDDSIWEKLGVVDSVWELMKVIES